MVDNGTNKNIIVVRDISSATDSTNSIMIVDNDNSAEETIETHHHPKSIQRRKHLIHSTVLSSLLSTACIFVPTRSSSPTLISEILVSDGSRLKS